MTVHNLTLLYFAFQVVVLSVDTKWGTQYCGRVLTASEHFLNNGIY